MEVIGAVVDGEVVDFAIEVKLSMADTIAIAPHQSREEGFGRVDTIVNVVVSLNDIGQVALTVGYHNGYDSAAIICDCHFVAIRIAQEEEIHLLSTNFLLEIGCFKSADCFIFHDF